MSVYCVFSELFNSVRFQHWMAVCLYVYEEIVHVIGSLMNIQIGQEDVRENGGHQRCNGVRT